jgi:uroporphyrinogen-III synthase
MTHLMGKRVVVTRPRERSAKLTALLEEAGAVVVCAPMIDIVPTRDPHDAGVLESLPGPFDWIAFTSANAVCAIEAQLAARAANLPKAAAVGPSTRSELERLGIAVRLTPRRASALDLAQALADVGAARVLHPCGADALDFVAMLKERGVAARSMVVYRKERTASKLQLTLPFDAICFASGSAIEAWLAVEKAPPPAVRVVCIGPTTAAAAQVHRIRVDAVADAPTDAAVVAALLRAFRT